MSIIVCCVLWIVAAAAGASDEVLRWTDERGRVHFGDRPPLNVETTIVETRINTYESPSIEALAEILAPSDKVVMYSASWCGVCRQAKKYFNQHKIPYKVYDIETSQKGKRDFKRLGASGVPVILIGKKRLNGFSAASFERLYKSR